MADLNACISETGVSGTVFSGTSIKTVLLTLIQSYVLPDAGRSSGQKTRVVKRSVSPIYNHTMVYEGFKPADLREACTELTVWHREGIKTHLLGGVRLSPGTGEIQTNTHRHT